MVEQQYRWLGLDNLVLGMGQDYFVDKTFNTKYSVKVNSSLMVE